MVATDARLHDPQLEPSRMVGRLCIRAGYKVEGAVDAYREALILCDLEEMSYPEVAVALHCPEGTVASRLHRARRMLKSRLQSMGCVR